MDEKEINLKALQDLQDGHLAVKMVVMVGVEKIADKPTQYITITPTCFDVELFKFWHNPKKSKKKNPKHAGNKRQYAMVFPDVNELPNDTVGMLSKLATLCDWNTGELKKPINELVKKTKTPETTLRRHIKALVNAGALIFESGVYKFNPKYAVKGSKKKGSGN